MVISQTKYRIVINDPTWVYAAPGNPGAYAAAALGGNVSAAQCKQIIACHKEEQTFYDDYLGVQEAGKELLLYGVVDNALAPLKKAVHQFWGCHNPLNDPTPTRENSNQDDNVTEV
jgi:hypothetical protein